MQKRSEAEIITAIQSGELFECLTEDGALAIKIEAYVPTVCTAIHSGHQFRTSLQRYCLLTDAERLYEEDPFTDQLIDAMPITLVAMDSRYEYDLNRPLATCIYKTAWGKKVWQKALPPKERQLSVNKHQQFYRILDALLKRVEKQFKAALVFDVHSYNHLRIEGESPTFNLGTEQLDLDRWSAALEKTKKRLQQIELPNLPVTVATNQVFYGRGYLAAHVNSRYENTLALPLEIKKVYIDELSGKPYPIILNSLNQQFKDCLTDVSAFFARRYTSKKRSKSSDMLAEKMDPTILNVDNRLYRVAKGLDTLQYINPINLQSEKKRFFKERGNYEPQFRYKPLQLDPYLFREQLYRLPVDSIRDPGIQALYRDVIDNLSGKIDMLVSIGQREFVYTSLKYYGEPSYADEKNANYLLHCADFERPDTQLLDQQALIERFTSAASGWNMQCKVEVSNRLVASAMVSNSRKAVMLAKGLSLPEKEAEALINHELGVHMATILNAASQRLKVFTLGLPGNTLAQEGLAILNEYHSGNMTLQRLKGLALRVMAVKEMLKGKSFRHTFSYLREEHGMAPDDAFKLSVRVHRGGGFTKDYLYLNGVSQALSLYEQQDISSLYVGKTGFAYLPIINEMIDRQLVTAPGYCPDWLKNPKPSEPVLDYLMHCIRYDNNGNSTEAEKHSWRSVA
jgi:uncharacterized protein (TIGR02421 family)